MRLKEQNLREVDIISSIGCLVTYCKIQMEKCIFRKIQKKEKKDEEEEQIDMHEEDGT